MHFDAKLSPPPPLTVLVIAVKPERAVPALADTCPCPVATAVLLDPRTDDAVFCAEAVGDLRKDLDVLQVRREIQLGAVIPPPAQQQRS